MISWACLLLLISFSLSFSVSLCVNDLLRLAKPCGGVKRGFKCDDPPSSFLGESQCSFLQASDDDRAALSLAVPTAGCRFSASCPLSPALAWWRTRGWGSSPTDPVIPRKAYTSTHAGFLKDLPVGDVRETGILISVGDCPHSAEESGMYI